MGSSQAHGYPCQTFLKDWPSCGSNTQAMFQDFHQLKLSGKRSQSHTNTAQVDKATGRMRRFCRQCPPLQEGRSHTSGFPRHLCILIPRLAPHRREGREQLDCIIGRQWTAHIHSVQSGGLSMVERLACKDDSSYCSVEGKFIVSCS